jgi:hypothetical protein
MARAAGKRSKKRGRRRPAPRLRLVNRLRWEEEGRFTDPISYIICAYDRRAEQLSSVGELPELAGLVIKAIMYFEIGVRIDAQKRPLPSRETLRTFFANQQLSDGSRLSPRLVGMMATLCLGLMKGGRPRKKQSPTDLAGYGLYEGQSARDRERVLLGLISGDVQPDIPSDEPTEAKKH